MAPLRRYLRITKYSVLECRVYFDNPALAQSWLLNPRDPVLPRVIEAVRPFVLPKLREERERSRKKSTKKRGIKDTVAQDDFEVSIFLTETNTRHSLLYKHKHFRDRTQTKLTSNSTKLTGGDSKDAPIDVDSHTADISVPSATIEQQEREGTTPIRILREDDDDNEVVPLYDIPSIDRDETNAAAESGLPQATRASKRRREPSGSSIRDNSDGVELACCARNPSQGTGASANVVVDSEDEDDLFVTDNDESDAEARRSATPTVDDDEVNTTVPPPAKRRRKTAAAAALAPPEEAQRDDKKKLAMDISYEGFSIYGRVLCLVVKRRDGVPKGKGKAVATTTAGSGSSSSAAAARGSIRGGPQSAAREGQAVMENWITSTQMPADVIAE